MRKGFDGLALLVQEKLRRDAVRVRELRERLGIAPFDPASQTEKTICVDKAALRLGICVGSVYKLIYPLLGSRIGARCVPNGGQIMRERHQCHAIDLRPERRCRIVPAHILIREVLIDLDDTTNEAVVTIHWNGGRHTELRVPRVRTGRYPADRRPNPVEVIRKIGGHWPDYQVAVTMNRMRCKPADGKAWTRRLALHWDWWSADR